MADLEIGNIPFSTSHNQKAFKLLELPPELLSLLESDNPPILTLSPDPSPSNNNYAILSTPDKSLLYHIRQKNTSNPIHLLYPTPMILEDPEIAIPEEEEEEEDENGVRNRNKTRIKGEGKEVLGISSISMIDDTLELHPVVREGKPEDRDRGAGGKVNKWHEKFAKGRGTK